MLVSVENQIVISVAGGEEIEVRRLEALLTDKLEVGRRRAKFFALIY